MFPPERESAGVSRISLPGREGSTAGGVDLRAPRLQAAAATSACSPHQAASSTAGPRGRVRDSDTQLGIGPCGRMDVDKRTGGRGCAETTCGSSVHGESACSVQPRGFRPLRSRARKHHQPAAGPLRGDLLEVDLLRASVEVALCQTPNQLVALGVPALRPWGSWGFPPAWWRRCARLD